MMAHLLHGVEPPKPIDIVFSRLIRLNESIQGGKGGIVRIEITEDAFDWLRREVSKVATFKADEKTLPPDEIDVDGVKFVRAVTRMAAWSDDDK